MANKNAPKNICLSGGKCSKICQALLLFFSIWEDSLGWHCCPEGMDVGPALPGQEA